MTAPAGFQIAQIGLVVRDLAATMRTYATSLGWEPWSVFRLEPPLLHDTTLRGEPASFTFLAALTQVGATQFELIQPLDGRSAYTEHLDAHGEGLHHLALTAPPGLGAEDICELLGGRVLMSGHIGDATQFVYLDAQPALKVIVETGEGGASNLVPAYVYP
jgi:hypothetical protein